MAWKEENSERTCRMTRTTDIADTIKASVSMQDVAEYYGFSINRRTRKIICPFHEDTNPSLHIYAGSKGYHCFVCGAGGDVIDFVMRLFNLSFMEACKKMNDDFRLNLKIGGERTEEEKREAERAYCERMEKKRAEEQKRDFLHALYDAAYNRYTFLDILKRENEPKKQSDPVSPDYIYACKHIDGAWHDVELALGRIREYENERNKQHEHDSR